MASTAQGVRKLSSEILEALEDKVASLRAAGKLDEAAEAEKELARVRKQYAQDERDGVFDPSAEASQAPDATDWNKPLLVGADKPQSTFSEFYPDTFTPDFSVGGKSVKDTGQFSTDYTDAIRKEALERNVPLAQVMKERGRPYTASDAPAGPGSPFAAADSAIASVRGKQFPDRDPSSWSTPLPKSGAEQGYSVGVPESNRGKMAGLVGAGTAAGLYAAFGSSGAKAPGEPTPLTSEKQQEAPTELALSAGGMSAKAAPTIDKSEMSVIEDILSTLAEPPKGDDFTQWNADMKSLAGDREKLASQLKKDIAQAQAVADVASSSLERRELIETITNAVGQMVSGLYGLRTGLDLSGAKFHRTDWNAKMEQLRNKLRDNVAILVQQQQLDQSLIDERRNALLQEKDTMLQKYNQGLQTWMGKLSVSKARQELETTKARMQLQNEQFNINQQRLVEEAIKREAARGAAPRDQISAGLKAVTGERESILKRWHQLAAEANDKKLSSDQRRAKMNEMEQLDRKYAEMTGLALLPSDNDPSMPRSYSDLDPDDVVAAAAGRFAKRDELMKRAYEKNPRYYEVLNDPDSALTQLAQGALASNPSMGAIAAMKHATKEYNKAVRIILADMAQASQGGK